MSAQFGNKKTLGNNNLNKLKKSMGVKKKYEVEFEEVVVTRATIEALDENEAKRVAEEHHRTGQTTFLTKPGTLKGHIISIVEL